MAIWCFGNVEAGGAEGLATARRRRPGLGDAMHQARRAGCAFCDFRAVSARQTHPGAAAAAVNAD
jgi:hypothetical protein